MPPAIDIDDDLFELLQQHAEPLVDTPSTVLRRLIGENANGAGPVERSEAVGKARPRTRRSRRGRLRGSGGGKRAARGSLLPESEYELPILRYLNEYGGRAPSREVVDGVGEAMADKLTETDKETLRSGDLRWKSRVAFVRLRLIERGDLDGDSPRGTWQITDQGRKRLRAES
jgi:hypothetical protein